MTQINLIQKLKECEEMPLFRKVLLNQTSFEDEIEKFYGYERWISHGRYGDYTYYKLNKKGTRITMLGTLGVVPSLSLVHAETPYPLIGIAMSSIFLTIAIKYLIAKNKYGEDYKELKRLSATAQTLDDNMEQYRLNFIKEKFDK